MNKEILRLIDRVFDNPKTTGEIYAIIRAKGDSIPSSIEDWIEYLYLDKHLPF